MDCGVVLIDIMYMCVYREGSVEGGVAAGTREGRHCVEVWPGSGGYSAWG